MDSETKKEFDLLGLVMQKQLMKRTDVSHSLGFAHGSQDSQTEGLVSLVLYRHMNVPQLKALDVCIVV